MAARLRAAPRGVDTDGKGTGGNMQSFARRESSWTLEKSAIVLLLFAFLAIAGLVGYYYWERQAQQGVALLDREAQQIEARIREDPQNAESRVFVANVYLQKGLVDRAIEQYRQALVLEEGNVVAIIGLGTAYMQKGLKDEAIRSFNRAAELIGEGEFTKLDQRVAAIRYNLGKIYLDGGQLEQASKELAQAREIGRSNADILNLSALVSQKQGNHPEAVEYFTRALRFDPAFVEAYRGLAVSYKTLGEGDRASYAEAMAALFSGQVDSAVGKLEGLAARTQDADVYWGLGWGYERKGQRENARAAYHKAVNIDPRHGMAVSGLQRLQASR